jgi:glycosyltransferase involved in cell wall biosynthesis
MTIRLFIIISSFAVEGPEGGIERFGVELARRLDRSQFDITLCGLWRYDLDHETGWMHRLSDGGIQVVTTAPWTGVRRHDAQVSLRFLRDYFKGHQADIVNSHTHFAHLATVLTRRRSGAKATLRTVHNEREWYRQPRLGTILNNLVFPWAFDAEVGVSQKVVDALNRRPFARLLGKRAQVAYNAIDHSRFAGVEVDPAAKRRALNLDLDQPVIGSVGRFTEQKGYRYFLEAARLIVDWYPGCQFVLIGTGELLPQMEALAAKADLADNVHFLGLRTDVEEILPAMDVFVSSSLWEGLPTVILEAMAAGVAVVATEVSGSIELVKDGVTGLLVPPAKPTAIADAVRELLQNPERAEKLSAAARQWSQRFSIEGVAAQYQEIYVNLWSEQGV